jgi:hypothetical protein
MPGLTAICATMPRAQASRLIDYLWDFSSGFFSCSPTSSHSNHIAIIEEAKAAASGDKVPSMAAFLIVP